MTTLRRTPRYTLVLALTLVIAASACNTSGPPPRWKPTAGLTWQWQLDSGAIDTSVQADVYDVDLFEVPASTIAALRAKGRRTVCYFSAAYESYRPDAGSFPSVVLGKPIDGWAGERWVDIRRLDLLLPIMNKRLDLCKQKGFDGAEPDLVEAYPENTGFPLTAADQLRYNRALADLAHSKGLAIGLKNDLGQVGQLVDHFDFAVNEQCHEYRECAALSPFIQQGKPVFHAEYALTTTQFCPTTQALGFASIRKRLDLDAWRQTCPSVG